ncbi:hypothetical protein KA111_01715 [Candidatus Woesebacteria bacterium]|nr:hypothetical protein [Candidatus Woesebacteria bacterium]
MSIFKSTLRAVIHTSDLTNFLHWKNKSDLNFLSLQSKQSFIKLAAFSYPKTTFNINKYELSCSYLLADDDKFTITLSEKGCQISTPLLSELQVFWFKTNSVLYFADSFFDLIELIPVNERPKLNLTGILEYITHTYSIQNRTLFHGVTLLSGNQILNWNKNDVNIKLRKPVADQIKSFPVPKNKLEAINKISNLVSAQIAKISPILVKVGALSGGTDSAIISHLATKFGCTKFITILLSGEAAAIQLKQLSQIKKYIKGDFFTSKANHQPLLVSQENWQLDPYINPYLSINLPLIKQIKKANCEIHLDGIGGGDFFSISRQISKNKEIKTNDLKIFSEFFSDLGKSHFSEKLATNTSKNINTLIPSDLSSTLLEKNIPFKKAGIWPISPFLSNSLISYSLHLPKEMMYGKAVLNTYLENNFQMTDQKKTGSFFPYFSESFKKLVQEKGVEFYTNSLLFSSGLFDNSKVMDLVKKMLKESEDVSNSDKSFLFFFTRLEIYFRYLYP